MGGENQDGTHTNLFLQNELEKLIRYICLFQDVDICQPEEHERMGYHCGKGRKKFLRGLPLLKLFVRCWSVLPEFDF